MMTQLRQTLNKITAFLSCLIMGIMTVLVTWQVITRFVFNAPSTMGSYYKAQVNHDMYGD